MKQRALHDRLWANLAGALAHDLRNDLSALADLVGYVGEGMLPQDTATAAARATADGNAIVQRLLGTPRRMRDRPNETWEPQPSRLRLPGAPPTATVWAAPAAVDAVAAALQDHPSAVICGVTPSADAWVVTLRSPWRAWSDVDDVRLALCGLVVLAAEGRCEDADGLRFALPVADV